MATPYRGSAARNWCFSINNPGTQDGDLRIPADALAKVTYYIVSLEQAPTTGTPHYQGFIQVKPKQRMSWFKKFWPTAHLEVCRGSPMQNYEYCVKDSTHVAGPWTHGVIDVTQGSRSDLADIGEEIVSGKKVSAIAEEQPASFIRYSRGMRALEAVVARREVTSEIRDPYVYVLWGAAGTGKTSLPFAYYSESDVYILHMTPGQHLWFDGYDREPVLIIDDFTGWIPFRTLLGLLDRYTCRIEVKGGFTYARWSRVFITSNLSPDVWYQHQDLAPLERRISYVWHFPDDAELARQVVEGTRLLSGGQREGDPPLAVEEPCAVNLGGDPSP